MQSLLVILSQVFTKYLYVLLFLNTYMLTFLKILYMLLFLIALLMWLFLKALFMLLFSNVLLKDTSAYTLTGASYRQTHEMF